MPDYSNGKVYKIVCNETGLIYIGSTCEPTLARRLAKHVGNYKEWCSNKHNYITSYKILENGNYDIVLLENIPCETKDELHARERRYIETLECVNKCIPGRTHKEYVKIWYEKNKEKTTIRRKEYYKDNKEKIIKYQKDYEDKNKEKVTIRRKEYYENNKEILNIKFKEYYENNKEARNASHKIYLTKIRAIKVVCGCGSTYTECRIKEHERTDKHQAYIKIQEGL